MPADESVNADFCRTLSEFIHGNDKSPTLFAGAGVAARAGLPVWSDYIKALAEQCRPFNTLTRHQMVESVAHGDYAGAAEYYFICKEFPQAEKFRALREPLDEADPRAIEALARLPFRSYVTTNYDRSLFGAYSRVRGAAPEEVNLNDSTLASAQFNSNFYVARIHGRIEAAETMVLADRHYEQLMQNSHYIDFLRHLFTRERLVFVGFSFLDPAIRNVLHTVEANVGKCHDGRHLALLPAGVEGEFVRELERFNIQKLFYPADQQHLALWECLEEVAAKGERELSNVSPAASEPFAAARQYLASCFARASIGARVIPLRMAMVEGIVAATLREAGGASVGNHSIRNSIADALAIPPDDAQHLLSIALDGLSREDLCVVEGGDETGSATWIGEKVDPFGEALSTLVDSAVRRYKVRGQGADVPEVRRCLEALFELIILRRGWDLGAAFASNTPPDSVDVYEILESSNLCAEVKSEQAAIGRVVQDLLTNPNANEAALLADLGRASFALELVLNSPKDTLFHSSTLPSRIYLDANVLMPAVTPGHPYHEVYRSTMERLVEASAEALVDVEIVAYDGYLNEVVSHRRLAIEEVGRLGEVDRKALRREAMLYGTVNMNVFVGAYANLLANDASLTFSEFLSRYAPYENERSLGVWLKGKGIHVKNERDMKVGATSYPDILHNLEKANAQGRWKAKQGIVVMHDAVQLGALARDLDGGRRAIFVSADRRLRDNIAAHNFGRLADASISHVGLTQLVDLLVGTKSESRGLTKLLWSPRVSSESERVREYLIDMALDSYDAGMALEMNQLVDNIAEDAVFALEAQGLRVNGNSLQERQKVMKVLEGFEDRFYAGMESAIERHRKNNKSD